MRILLSEGVIDVRVVGFDFRFVHEAANGEILEDSGWLPNHMTDDGFELLYDVFFRDATAPSKFMIGLNTAPLSQTDSLTDLSEVTGTNYSLKDLTRDGTGFPTLALDNNDMQITSAEVEFENEDATDPWDGAHTAFMLGDLATNVLICYRALSTERTLQAGDKLKVTMRVKGEQPQ